MDGVGDDQARILRQQNIPCPPPRVSPQFKDPASESKQKNVRSRGQGGEQESTTGWKGIRRSINEAGQRLETGDHNPGTVLFDDLYGLACSMPALQLIGCVG